MEGNGSDVKRKRGLCLSAFLSCARLRVKRGEKLSQSSTLSISGASSRDENNGPNNRYEALSDTPVPGLARLLFDR